MQKLITSFLFICGIIIAPLLLVAPAQAQATRTWVSGVGDDVNPCSRTAPCKTFAGAISKTAVGGEINCLDPGGFGAVTITKSITIDCHEIFASILHSGTNGIIIAFDSFGGADAARTVRLRNLNFNGAGLSGLGINSIRIIGTTGSANSEVFIEDCLMDGNSTRGISDERSGGGELTVMNTTIRNMGTTGIVILPVSGSTRISATLDRVYVSNSNFGLSASNGSRVMISRSVFSGNTSAGIEAEGPTGASEVDVDGTVSANNGTGIQSVAGSTIRVSNSDITFNTNAFSGAVQSFGNNRVAGPIGVAPALIGAVTNDHGQN